ncbi:MAG: hypothetical protein LBG99_02850 [Propionibacteriaceae bacterium]|jgi:hypothetical protein|nr:hypothetical protein [Propionibacteriaceae bacterium]
MQLSRKLEQQIAVFGESGSGKTVLISSFYGATQEPYFLQKSLFDVIADDFGQRAHLHQNYLGMKNSAKLPMATRFRGSSYSFTVKLKELPGGKSSKKPPKQLFDALRLVWHDYPGEWFEQNLVDPEEAQHRVNTFRSLVGSDVALLLVDGQKLLDNAGEEERYLKSLFTNFRNGLLSLKDDLLEGGKPLVDFPRIWVLALSKSDLLPDVDVFRFKELLIEKVAGEIVELRNVLAGFVDSSDALSVAEDYILLSSAKFNPDKIEVSERVGVAAILPLASILPFERHLRWVQTKKAVGKVAESLLSVAGIFATAMIGGKLKSSTKEKKTGKLSGLVKLAGIVDVAVEAVKLAGEKLRILNEQAISQGDTLSAVLTQFQLDLEKCEEDRVLHRSIG